MKILLKKDIVDDLNSPQVLFLKNDLDPREIKINDIKRIELEFPKFTDGRAFSQAYLLRRRMKFTGEIRATGDVLIDQLVQMKRSGFDSAVLRADQDLSIISSQMNRFKQFYQADAVTTNKPFSGKA